MVSPANIYVTDPLYDGYWADVSWEPVEGATRYILQRRFDRYFEDDTPGCTWIDIELSDLTWGEIEAKDKTWDELERSVPDYDYTIYEGESTYFRDRLIDGARYVIYRVKAARDYDYTWEEFEAFDYTWDELDALGWSWEIESSEFTTTDLLPIIANRPPVISGADENLGIRYSQFTVSFSAYDPDPENIISGIAKIGNSVISQWSYLAQNQVYTVTVDATKYAYNTTHQIVITVTDNKGASSQRILTFKVLKTTYYIYRDDVRIAEVFDQFEFRDYMHVGLHRYYIEVVDDDDVVSYSNTVEIYIPVEYATIALVESPEDYMELKLRRDQPTQITKSFGFGFEEMRFVGVSMPRYRRNFEDSMKVTAVFSTTEEEEYNHLYSILSKGETVVYRDKHENRVVGIVPNQGFDYFLTNRKANQFNKITDFSIDVIQTDYIEEVGYD